MNVGASKPSDSGLYFQWGDTVGYTKDQIGTGNGQKKLDWNDYKFNPSGDGKTFTKYTTPGAKLELKDDAAHVIMGGSWHIPTTEQIQELINNTTTAWTTSNGVSGMTFASKIDKSKSIFVPTAGYFRDGSIYYVGQYGGFWSSMIRGDIINDAGGIDCFSSGVHLSSEGYRKDVQPIRGVIG